MANTMDVEMEYCEPDSTIEIVDVEGIEETDEQTPLQAMNQQLVNRQYLCANMVAASIRERNRVRSELEHARKRRERKSKELNVMLNMSNIATKSNIDAKASLKEAVDKRSAALKDIEVEKTWRPPAAVMCLKKQQELRERVAHMRRILGTGKICSPDH